MLFREPEKVFFEDAQLSVGDGPNLAQRHHHPSVGYVLNCRAVVDPFAGFIWATALNGADEAEGGVIRFLEPFPYFFKKRRI